MFADPTLGKYHLIAEIARGGMGVVFLALNQGPGGFSKLVVVKELKGELAEDPSFLTMFLDEARLAARLNHPNIVQTNEVASEGERHFMAMEYLDGRTYERIRRRAKHVNSPTFTLQMQLHIMCDVLGALEYAHRLADFDTTPLHVVHRDISPNNVFITFDGHVKVLDFGIAKAADHHHETQAGAIKGKLSYMAPEQARGQKVDARADVFAVGVMLWEAIASRKLRSGGKDEILEVAGGKEAPLLSTVVPDVSPELERIVAKAVASNRDDRYPSAAALQGELEQYIMMFGTSTSARDLAAAVTGLFNEERAKINTMIETQVARARAGAAQTDLPVIELGGSPPPVATPVARVETFAAQTTDPKLGIGTGSLLPSQAGDNADAATSFSGLGSQRMQVVTAGPSKRALWIAGGVAVAGIAAALLVVTRGDKPPARVADAPPVAMTAQPADAAPAPQPGAAMQQPPEPAAQPNTVDVNIQVNPPSARITVDGAEVSANPFRGRYRADGVMHRIRAEAPGYRATSRDVAFDGTVTLQLDLEEVARATTTTATARKSRPPAKAPTRPEIRETPPPTPVLATEIKAPPEPKVEPKKDDTQINPQGGQKPRRTIDAKNPYQ